MKVSSRRNDSRRQRVNTFRCAVWSCPERKKRGMAACQLRRYKIFVRSLFRAVTARLERSRELLISACNERFHSFEDSYRNVRRGRFFSNARRTQTIRWRIPLRKKILRSKCFQRPESFANEAISARRILESGCANVQTFITFKRTASEAYFPTR